MIAVTSAVLFVTDFLFSPTTAIASTAGIFALLMTCWWILPLRRRASLRGPR